MKQKVFKLLIGLGVTIGAIYFLIPLIDIGRIKAAFLMADPKWVTLGFLAYIAVYVARALRFWVLLPERKASFLALLKITMLHGAAVRVFPNPLGELVFIGGTKTLGVRYSQSLSVLLVCRALDFAVIALFLFVGAVFLIPDTGLIAFVTALFGGGIALASIGIIAIASFYQQPLIRFLGYLEGRFPKRSTFITKKMTALVEAFRFLREKKVYSDAVLSSIALWIFMFITYGAFFRAAGNIVSMVELLVAGSVQVLTNVLPSIGGIGTMEAGWIMGFTISDTESAEALAGAIFVNVATLVGTLAMGALGLLWLWLAKARSYSSWQMASRGVLVLLVFVVVIQIVGQLPKSWFISQKEKVVEFTDSIPGEEVRFFETYSRVAVDAAWVSYRSGIQKDGRTIDRGRDYLTTSEGQSYSLLRAVWMDDKDTFDRVLKWTNNNLAKRPNDELFAWLWGKDSNNKWDVLYEQNGLNTASDADQDIALALIFAAERWNQDHYMEQAKEILNDIWETEVVVVKGKPYLTAGNWAIIESRPTLNPSYFSFAAYPIFAAVDPEHPWLELKDTSYEVLNESSSQAFAGTTAVGLPPDWASINRTTGAVEPPIHADKTINFSDDAFRTLWRVALDWEWHQDQRAYEYLSKMNFFEEEWQKQGKIYGSYTHDGQPVVWTESESLYAVVGSSFQLIKPEFAKEVFDAKVAPLYRADTEELDPKLGYYAQNWVWFGMALSANSVPNLYLAR